MNAEQLARGLHATEQALSDERIAVRNAFVVAAAAHGYCAAFEHDAVHSLILHEVLMEAHRATTPSAIPPTHVVVAVAELERLRDALRLIAGEKCENYTGRTRCWDEGWGRTRGAPCTAEAWCDACIAQAALDGRAS